MKTKMLKLEPIKEIQEIRDDIESLKISLNQLKYENVFEISPLYIDYLYPKLRDIIDKLILELKEKKQSEYILEWCLKTKHKVSNENKINFCDFETKTLNLKKSTDERIKSSQELIKIYMKTKKYPKKLMEDLNNSLKRLENLMKNSEAVPEKSPNNEDKSKK